MQKVYILDAKRTPIGSILGQLKSVDGVSLATETAKTVIKSLPDPKLIEEVIYGCVLTAGMKQSPSR